MNLLYSVAGTGIGLTILFLYIKYKIKEAEQLKNKVSTLEQKKAYRDEVIEQLSKPQSINDTIDKLRTGEF